MKFVDHEFEESYMIIIKVSTDNMQHIRENLKLAYVLSGIGVHHAFNVEEVDIHNYIKNDVRPVQLVRVLSSPRSVVLSCCLDDPFSGSGSAPAAATMEGPGAKGQETFIAMRRLRGLLPQLVGNPFMGEIVSALAAGDHTGPPD